MGLLAELVLHNAGPSWTPVSVAGEQGWIPSIHCCALAAERCGIRLSGEPLSTERAVAVEAALMADVHAAERENGLRQRGWNLHGDGLWSPRGCPLTVPLDRALVLEACNAMQRWLDRRNAPVPFTMRTDVLESAPPLAAHPDAHGRCWPRGVPYDG
jgi:hypothetical protein